MGGNATAAAVHYKDAMAAGLTLHSAVLVSDFFLRTGRPEIADVIGKSLDNLYPSNPFVMALAHQDKQRIPSPNVSHPAEGAGIVLYDLAALLYEKHAYDSARIYAGMAGMLLPRSPFVAMMKGDIAALRNLYDEAAADYAAVSPDSPLYWLSRMRTAEVSELQGQTDHAAALLEDLAKIPLMRINALVALGDLYRRHDSYAKAVSAYDEALEDIGTPTADQWEIVYARGMAFQRLNNWPKAEKDLMQALALQPDNPDLLNFIGYSWTERGMNTDKALSYLRKAVDLKPRDGFILDSYGWALYRSGQYAEAVKWMEQAISRMPDDATVLDHLGDAYWQTGRKAEARFKWLRAAELSDDKTFRTTVSRKLNTGLPLPAPVRHGDKEAKL
jgi:Flp pilus assembly protein TadD